MSLKLKKVIMFIPIVNFIIVFFWLGVYRKYQTAPFCFIKKLCMIFGILIVLNIPRIIIYKFVDNILLSIITYISAYFYILLQDAIALKDEEEIIELNKIN